MRRAKSILLMFSLALMSLSQVTQAAESSPKGNGRPWPPGFAHNASAETDIKILNNAPQTPAMQELFAVARQALGAIAEKGKHLKKITFGRGSVIFPEDVERLKAALPGVEVITEPYDKALHGNKFYGPRLKGLMSAEEYARLEKLAGPAK